MSNPRSENSGDATTTCQGLGVRLRESRLEQGLSVEDVSCRLRVPHHVVKDLEADDHSRLGAPIFVRGHAQAYARLLGLDLHSECSAIGREASPPPLVAMAPSTRLQRLVDQASRRAVYVVLTAVLVVPAFFIATQGPQELSRVSLDDTRSMGGVGTMLDLGVEPQQPAVVERPRVEVSGPVIASMTPYRARQDQPRTADGAPAATPAAFAGLVLRFSGESWVEVVGHDGERLEQSLMRAGDELRFDAGQVARVTLGNAGVVEVVSGGDRHSTEPFSRANVARFAVSSDGRLAATGG